MSWRRALLAGLLPVALLAVALVWRYAAAFMLSLGLAAPAAEAWVAGLHGQPDRQETTIATDSGHLQTDLYRPARPRGTLLLVHGLSRAGRRQPDLARLAHLLGKQGVLVVVPQFEGLAAFRLTGKEVDEVRAALRYTVALHQSAGIAGFSFGAGPALLAAADFPGLRVVGSFGGYADLRNVVTFISTGAHSFDGGRYVQRQEEYNRWKLLALLVGFLSHQQDGELLGQIVQQKLANPHADTRQIEQGVGPNGRAVLALVLNQREDAVGDLLGQLPPGARAALSRLSPLPAIPRIRAQLVIAHGTADDSIPFTESLRLAAAAGDRAQVALFETFHHTGPEALWTSLWLRARDAWRLVRVADELLPR